MKTGYSQCAFDLEGHHGLKDVYQGPPVKPGKGGIKQVIELKTNPGRARSIAMHHLKQ